MRKRIAARKIILRVITNWSRRFLLKWKRKHGTLLVKFFDDIRTMVVTRKAVKRYRQLVVLTQRRFRAYHTMWKARLELAERQFLRVQDVMVQQAGRARKKMPMSYRRNDALRRIPRDINDELAKNKVLPIEEVATEAAMRQVLAKHVQQRKQEHLASVYKFFEHRCEYLRIIKTRAPLDRAKALMQGTLDPSMSLEDFARQRMSTGLQEMQRPWYHPVIPIVSMATLVHEARQSPQAKQAAGWNSHF